jgi:hypothetical protein
MGAFSWFSVFLFSSRFMARVSRVWAGFFSLGGRGKAKSVWRSSPSGSESLGDGLGRADRFLALQPPPEHQTRPIIMAFKDFQGTVLL